MTEIVGGPPQEEADVAVMCNCDSLVGYGECCILEDGRVRSQAVCVISRRL
jgi:hypothetical protein